jgi:hypothetical protein
MSERTLSPVKPDATLSNEEVTDKGDKVNKKDSEPKQRTLYRLLDDDEDSDDDDNSEISDIESAEDYTSNEADFKSDTESTNNGCVSGSSSIRDKKWEEKFQLLVDYKKKYNTTKVPHTVPTLGRWVQVQRSAYKKNQLPERRLQRLNSVGFLLNALSATWMETYNRLLSYKAQNNGSTNVPGHSGPLSSWVMKQREVYSKCLLSKERIDLLESIGF